MEQKIEVLKGIDSTGLDFWMETVMRQCDRVRSNFDAEPVHDLRVALRRCRSMADGFMAFDPHPAWKQMKDEGRKLFQQLGALRDTQVMLDWLQRLAPSLDSVRFALNQHLTDQEHRLKESASEAVRDFNQKKWASWTRLLSRHARHIAPESLAFQHLALERWSEARFLHRQALRNRTQIAYHRLRIGLKKFRYTVENFLPFRHESWGNDLKELQDILGEVHDLDVLHRTAVSIKALSNERSRLVWRQRIADERSRRLESYRAKMLGKTSLWYVWREGLPRADQIKTAAMARFRAWSEFRDPDFAHAEHVARLAIQIYEGLNSLGLLPADTPADAHLLLEAAALAHDVGISRGRKKHELNSYRMIRKLDPPLGWSAGSLRQTALIARFHRGALPHPHQKAFAGMSANMKPIILTLCGILRLANALDASHKRQIRRLEVKQEGEVLILTAPGYLEFDKTAEQLAAARHLLESTCRVAIVIR
jgi:CHAD domain-containing protein